MKKRAQMSPNRWSRIVPNWVRKMAAEEEKKDAGAEATRTEKVEEKKPEATELPKEGTGSTGSQVPRLEDVEKELEEERKKTEHLQKMLSEMQKIPPEVGQQQKEMADMATKLRADQERQQQLHREVQMRFGLPPPQMGWQVPMMTPAGCQPQWFHPAPGLVVNMAGGMPSMPTPATTTMPAGMTPGEMGTGKVPQPVGPKVGPVMEPMVKQRAVVAAAGVKGVKGPVQPEGPPQGRVLVKAIPTAPGSAAGSAMGTPPGSAKVQEVKKTPKPAKPVQPKEMPTSKKVEKKNEASGSAIPVDAEEPVDEEREREAWLSEQAKSPRVTDGLTEAQRRTRLTATQKANEKMAATVTEQQKEIRYRPKGAEQKEETTQLDRVEQKLDWLVACLDSRSQALPSAPAPPTKEWNRKEIKEWLLEQRRSDKGWKAPQGKGKLLEEALEEDRNRSTAKKRSWSAGDHYGQTQGWHGWQDQEEEEDDSWGRKWR